MAVIPILMGAGVAIDFARLATKHTSLQQATDSAALAIAHSATTSTTNADVLGMIVVWITGLTLAIWGGWFKSGWLHGKLALVVGLSAAHMYFARQRRLLAQGRNEKTTGFYRAVNEIPTLLMIGIVILVIVKPFWRKRRITSRRITPIKVQRSHRPRSRPTTPLSA